MPCQSGQASAISIGPSDQERLTSWKEIANYLSASVRTVQRWERSENLPVHRHGHCSGSTIYAFRPELDLWLKNRVPTKDLSRKYFWPAMGLASAALAATLLSAYSSRTAPPVQVASRVGRPFATGLPAQSYPAWSPDGKFLAFIGESRRDQRHLMIQPVDSAHAVQVAGSGPLRQQQFPFWSPDSRFVFFFEDDGDSPALLRASAMGGKPVLVQTATVAAALSPDGKTLVTLSQSPDRHWRIHTASPPEAQLRIYQPEPFASSMVLQRPNLAFSPDGRRILVTVNLPARSVQYVLLPWPPGPAQWSFPDSAGGITPRVSWMSDSRHVVYVSRGAIQIADTLTGREWSVATAERGALNGALSPDGSRLAYQLSLSHTDVVMVPLGDGPIKTLLGSSSSEEMAASSPTGDQLVYATDRRGRWELWLSNFDRSSERPLLFEGSRQIVPTAAAPAFSPDGQNVAFRAALSGSLTGIMTAPVAGGAEPTVAYQTPFAASPQWSPDGKWLVFVHLSDGRHYLAKLRLGTAGPPVNLIELVRTGTGFQLPPEWSPTGDWIAYGDDTYGLSLVSPDGKRRRVLGGKGPVVWTRDGRTILQVRSSEHAIVAIDLDTASVRKVRDVGDVLPYATREPGRRISLTPDGRNLVYSVLRPREEIWLRDGWHWRTSWLDRWRTGPTVNR